MIVVVTSPDSWGSITVMVERTVVVTVNICCWGAGASGGVSSLAIFTIASVVAGATVSVSVAVTVVAATI